MFYEIHVKYKEKSDVNTSATALHFNQQQWLMWTHELTEIADWQNKNKLYVTAFIRVETFRT